jgi:hypothetical protein
MNRSKHLMADVSNLFRPSAIPFLQENSFSTGKSGQQRKDHSEDNNSYQLEITGL